MQQIIDATVSALRRIDGPRFFESERAYQGELYCALREDLCRCGVLNGERILEMEYQKTAGRQGLTQRPDIILHIPAEYRGASVRENNFAVWALKRRATHAGALEDFAKLDQMFEGLEYPLGFFINIDSEVPCPVSYPVRHPERLRAFAVQLRSGRVEITQSTQAGTIRLL